MSTLIAPLRFLAVEDEIIKANERKNNESINSLQKHTDCR
jgi:hypothetical protein